MWWRTEWEELFSYCAFEDDAVIHIWRSNILCLNLLSQCNDRSQSKPGRVWPSSLWASTCMQNSFLLPLGRQRGIKKDLRGNACLSLAPVWLEKWQSSPYRHVGLGIIPMFCTYYSLLCSNNNALCFSSHIQYASAISVFATVAACFIIHYFAISVLLHTAEHTNSILLLDWLEKHFILQKMPVLEFIFCKQGSVCLARRYFTALCLHIMLHFRQLVYL